MGKTAKAQRKARSFDSHHGLWPLARPSASSGFRPTGLSRGAPFSAREPKLPNIRRLVIGADHGGFALKSRLIALLQGQGFEVADMGTHSSESCDYPKIGYKVARAVSQKVFERGVLSCKSGIGIAIVANKVPGIRAAVCNDVYDAKHSRLHNDANVLVLGAEKLTWPQIKRIVQVWLMTPFEAGTRHERRIRQIVAIERQVLQRRLPP